MELDRELAFEPTRAETFFESLPSRPAVVLLEPREGLTGARPLLLRTADLRRRLRLLLCEPEANSKRLNLRDYAGKVRFRVTGSPFEQTLLHWQQARRLWPLNYRERLRLSPPPVVKLNLSNAYPRAYVTRRVGGSGLYVGPFVSRRSADAFLEGFLDLFRIRRCQIKILRDPHFPGCIYSEMKMCLAPCFGGCTPEEYAAEAGRAAAFLRSAGASLADELARERESASAELNFERASAVHKRLERVQELGRSLPEIVGPLEELYALVVVPAATENAVALFHVFRGEIKDPFILQFSDLSSQPRSLEQILRELLEPVSTPPAEPKPENPERALTFRDLEDHLALLARWFYGSPRVGEIFFRQAGPMGWPYRRILRASKHLLEPNDTAKPPGQSSPNPPH